MTVRSRPGAVAGAVIALGVPLVFLVLAWLIEHGLAPYAEMRDNLSLFGLCGWISLFLLGPIGIAVMGWSVGIRHSSAWVALVVVSIPVVVVVWFAGVASLSGALGNPF